MKHRDRVSKLLTSKSVLYIIAAISLLNLLGYAFYGNFNAILYFIIIGLLVSYFSKNMIIVLLAPLILVNVLIIGQRNIKEGLETNTSTTSTTPSTPPSSDDEDEDTTKLQADGDLPVTPDQDSGSTETPSGNTTEPYRNKKGGHRIDYHSTIEEAYKDLDKVLGGAGISQLTTDTKDLMKKQASLAKTMKEFKPLLESMGPMITEAHSMIKGFGGTDGMSKLADMAKNLMPPK